MYDARRSAAIVFGNAATPYLFLGKQGSNSQGKIYLQGLKQGLPFKNIESVVKSAYAAAVLGTFTLPLTLGTAATLQIKAIGIHPTSHPETEEQTFVNVNQIASDTTATIWAARVATVCNANKTFAELFTITSSGATVTFTQVIPGVGKIAVNSSVGSNVVSVGTVGSANKGATGAQVAAMIASTVREYSVDVVGTYTAASDNFDVYDIQVSNYLGMNPYSFKENKPEKITLFLQTGLTTLEAALESIFQLSKVRTSALSATIVASTGVFTRNSHGLTHNQKVRVETVTTTTGLTVGNEYFVKVIDANTYTLSATNGGANVSLTTDGSCTFSYIPKVHQLATALGTGKTLTASSGNIAFSSHGLVQNQKVIVNIYTTTGIPNGLAQPYFVNWVDANTITLALTPGGAAVTGTTNGTADIYLLPDTFSVLDYSGDAVPQELLAPSWLS